MELKFFLAGVPRGDLWIFGYGSLMWSPDFRFAEKHPGHLYGFHRALCIYSHRYRGTPDKPGLVMGLCRGGSCWGMAFRVAAPRVRATLGRLWQREMRNRVYFPRMLAVRIGKRRVVRALAYVADTAHGQFAGDLSLEKTANLIAQGCGERGDNLAYLANTLAHMDAIGVRDPHLARVFGRAARLCGR